jgi:hypothetical protein
MSGDTGGISRGASVVSASPVSVVPAGVVSVGFVPAVVTAGVVCCISPALLQQTSKSSRIGAVSNKNIILILVLIS